MYFVSATKFHELSIAAIYVNNLRTKTGSLHWEFLMANYHIETRSKINLIYYKKLS